jgi:hypothetical protein
MKSLLITVLPPERMNLDINVIYMFMDGYILS